MLSRQHALLLLNTRCVLLASSRQLLIYHGIEDLQEAAEGC